MENAPECPLSEGGGVRSLFGQCLNRGCNFLSGGPNTFNPCSFHMYHKMHRLPPSRYDNKSWGNGYSPPWFSKTCSAQGKYPASSEQRSQPTQIIWVFPDTTLLKLLLFTEFQSLIQASIRQIYMTLSQTDLCGDYALLSRHRLCRTNMLLSRIMSWHNLCSEYALFGVCFVQTLTQI